MSTEPVQPQNSIFIAAGHPKSTCILPGIGAREPGARLQLCSPSPPRQCCLPKLQCRQRALCTGAEVLSLRAANSLNSSLSTREIQWAPNASLNYKSARHQQQGKEMPSMYANTALQAGICWCCCTVPLLQLPLLFTKLENSEKTPFPGGKTDSLPAAAPA